MSEEERKGLAVYFAGELGVRLQRLELGPEEEDPARARVVQRLLAGPISH